MKKVFTLVFALISSFASIGLVNVGYEDDFLFGDEDDSSIDIFLDELDGVSDLGRIRSSLARFRKTRVNRTKQKEQRLLQSTMDRGQRYLRAKVSQLPPAMQQSFEGKRLNYSDQVIYHTTIIDTFAGITELVKSNEPIGPGYTNLNDQGVVPKDLAMEVNYIAALYNLYTEEQGLFGTDLGAMRNSSFLAAADLEIVVNGEVIRTLPIRVLNETRVLRNSIPAASHAGYNLSTPFFLKEDDKIQVRVKMADGVSFASGVHYDIGARFEFYGSSLTSK